MLACVKLIVVFACSLIQQSSGPPFGGGIGGWGSSLLCGIGVPLDWGLPHSPAISGLTYPVTITENINKIEQQQINLTECLVTLPLNVNY